MATKKKAQKIGYAGRGSMNLPPKKKIAAKKPEIKPIASTVKALLKAYANGTLNKKKHIIKIDNFDDRVFVEVPTGAKGDDKKLILGISGDPEADHVFEMHDEEFVLQCLHELGGIKGEYV